MPDGMNTQKAGRNKPRGRGGGRGHTRRHTAATEDKRREGRKGGRRGGHGWPRAWGAEEGSGREQTDRGKKEIYKYLRERRREKRRRDSQKRASVCIYILLNIAACGLLIALSFIYRGSI